MTGLSRIISRQPSANATAAEPCDEREQPHRPLAHDRAGDTGVEGDERKYA